jgi:hypothetical protein
MRDLELFADHHHHGLALRSVRLDGLGFAVRRIDRAALEGETTAEFTVPSIDPPCPRETPQE